MFDKIAPGSRVVVKVVRQPTNAAASKTLVRLLSRDPAVKTQVRRQRRIRQRRNEPRTRGGRIWVRRLVKQHPVRGRLGESATLVAGVDVLRDLGSVRRFVEVTEA